jgi:hypothetical protein
MTGIDIAGRLVGKTKKTKRGERTMTAYVQDFVSKESTGTLIDLHIERDKKPRSARALSALNSLLQPVMVYFREDLCRAVFIFSIAIVMVSAALYQLGWMNKTEMQQYLILKEIKEVEKRKYDVLIRSIAGLEALGGTPWVQESTRDEALAHLNNISVYFSVNENKALSAFFLDKILELRTDLQRSGGESILRNTEVPDRKGLNHVYLNMMAVLNAFASKEKEVVQANEQRLQSDARKELVGSVGRFNVMMDCTADICFVFLVMTIACIPGLGRHTKTGFV